MPQIKGAIKTKTDLALVDVEDITRHYARTLEIWREDFKKVFARSKRTWFFRIFYKNLGVLPYIL